MKILAVDDSRMMRRIISGAAAVMGYDTLEAADGKEALEVLSAESPEVACITLDVNMPVMSGLECLESIMENDRFSKIPVIMMTTEAEKATMLRAVRLGARHYVTKPFTPEDLTTRFMEVLGDDDEF